MTVPWRPMAQCPDSVGRMVHVLRNGKVKRTFYAHALVAKAFLPPKPPGKEICHDDGNPANNVWTNLRWDTHVNNMADRERHGTAPIGSQNPAAQLDEDAVRAIRRRYRDGELQKDIAPDYNVSKQTVQAICARTIWAHVQDAA